jgi:hypothetical protein
MVYSVQFFHKVLITYNCTMYKIITAQLTGVALSIVYGMVVTNNYGILN